jgi:DmsE family decaheme c-type cytochrome
MVAQLGKFTSATTVLLVLLFCASICGYAAGTDVSQAVPAKSTTVSQPPGKQTQVSPEATGPATYVGAKVCESCHELAKREFSQTVMGKILLEHPRDEVEGRGCETCHGPGSVYVAAMAKAMAHGAKPDQPVHGPSVGGVISFRPDGGQTPDEQNAVCLTCHNRGAQAFWRASTHASRGLRCTDCHFIMRKISPRFQLRVAMESNPFVTTRPETQVCLRCHLQKKMQINLPSHMPLREGLMVCTDCHNPHGGPYPDQLVRATVNEVCYTCHAEKRGPFLWIHPPEVQSCLNCHTPHGSVNRFLLKLRPPRLCQQCHIGSFHPSEPHAPGEVFVFGSACLHCHSAIHGSNAPGGYALTR